jgi:hypothetical protein
MTPVDNTDPANVLRAAATRLRELAAPATPGPWRAIDLGPHGHPRVWIAALDPAVAEPLAAWLELAATANHHFGHPLDVARAILATSTTDTPR